MRDGVGPETKKHGVSPRAAATSIAGRSASSAPEGPRSGLISETRTVAASTLDARRPDARIFSIPPATSSVNFSETTPVVEMPAVA